MPVPPYVWQARDFPGSSLLSSELRQTGGAYFQPNGVRFHATRPVYKTYARVTPSSAANVWNNMTSATPGNYMSLSDPAFIDPQNSAGMAGVNLLNGGGIIGSPGGLGLVMVDAPYASSTTSFGAAGVGNTISTHLSTGTISPFPTAGQAVTCLAVDLLDWGTQTLIGQFFTASGISPMAAISTDGSGSAHRTQAFWASVYPSNGLALSGSSLPAITSSIANGNLLTPSILNTTIEQTLQLFNMPPALRVQASVATSVGAAFATIGYSAPSTDTYGAFASNTYTCPLPGLYLVYVCAGVDSSTGSWIQQSIRVNGVNYVGPTAQGINGRNVSSAAMRVFNLNAGDTIIHQMASGAALTTSTANAPVMVVLWLGAAGAPLVGGLPVPDATYQFAAGTPPSGVASLLTNHVFQDISRLLYRPYAMAYQSSAQTGLTQSAFTTVNLQTTGCPVHSTSDNSYGSWSGGVWTAPTSGYYLIVGEVVCAQPSLTASPYIATGLATSVPGLNAVDQYEAHGLYSAGAGGGAAAIGIYYLASGDTIALKAAPINQSATTSGLFVSGTTFNSHMEIVWLGE